MIHAQHFAPKVVYDGTIGFRAQTRKWAEMVQQEETKVQAKASVELKDVTMAAMRA